MSDWEVLTLEDAGVELLDCVHKTPPAADDGLPYVAIPQMRNGEIDLSTARIIGRKHFEEWTRKANPQPDDVVLSRRCNPGETAYVRAGMEFALGQNLVLLRANDTRVRPAFLRWIVRSQYWWSEVEKFRNVGAVFDSLRCADVPRFRLPIPPLGDQDAIASILGALDDKIDLNRRMNETLEAMAQALFKSWFVDFDPVHAKAEGRQPANMDAETAALFPDAFDDEGKPVGWRRERLRLHVRARKGLSYKGMHLSNNGEPFHNLNSVLEGGGYKFDGIKFYAGEFKPKHVVHPGDLIMANTEQGFDHLLIGYSAVVPVSFGDSGIFSHHLYKIELVDSSPLSILYLHYLFAVSPEGEAMRRYSNGTTVNMLPADALELPRIAVPDRGVVSAFDAVVSPMQQLHERNLEESLTLAELRDALLPKLMSGKIRANDVERAE